MNLINRLIYEIKNQVPIELTELLFNHPRYRHDNSTLEAKIEENYLRPRFLYDLDAGGAQQMIVPMQSITEVYRDTSGITFRIDPAAVNNRRIVSVLGLTSMGGTTGTSSGQNSTLENMYDKLANAYTPANIFTSSDLELVGKNVFKLTTTQPFIPYGFSLRVMVGNDENLSNIHSPHNSYIIEACILGYEAFVYNKLIISINSGELQLGHSLGIIKQQIEDYRDRRRDYMEIMRTKIKRVQTINDGVSYARLIKMGFPR